MMIVLTHLTIALADWGGREGIKVLWLNWPMTKSGETLWIFGNVYIVFGLKLGVVCHAHLRYVHVVLRCGVYHFNILVHIWPNVVPICNVFINIYAYGIITQLYFRFEDLISRCNTLSTVTLKTIDRVLAQLVLACVIWTLDESR